MLLPHVPEAPTNIVESASLNIPPSCFGRLGPIIYQVLLVDITCSVRFLGLWPRLPRGGWLALVTYQSQPSLEMVVVSTNYYTELCDYRQVLELWQLHVMAECACRWSLVAGLDFFWRKG